MGRRLQRPQRHTRQTRTTILLITNGTRTEKEYLETIKRRVPRDAGLHITIRPDDGKEPETILRNLRSQRSDTADFDEVWIVADEDGHDRTAFLHNCQKATKPPVYAIISTPCFEVWLTAHYEQVRRYQDQADAQRHYGSVTGLTGREVKRIPPNFPYERAAEAEHRCVLRGEPVPGVNTQGPSPSTSIPHLLRRLGLLA